MIGGVAAAAGLLWMAQTEPTEVGGSPDTTLLGPAEDPSGTRTADTPPTTTTPATTTTVTNATLPPDSTTTLTSTTVTTVPTEPDLEPDPPETAPLVVRLDRHATPLAGAIVVHEGYVITVGHALGDADDVVVTWGEHHSDGIVVGHDEVTDVTVLRVDAHPEAAEATGEAGFAVGDSVTLTGSGTESLTQTVVDTASASERIDGEPLVGIVELDGALGDIPPGSPVLAADGTLIGLLTATAADAPAAFVPIGLVRSVAREIIELGSATHPWLGVRARNPDPDTVPSGDGSFITEVTPDGPADAGGIRTGDLIVEIADEPVSSMESMVATLRSHEPGDAVRIVVHRDGEIVNCDVELASLIDRSA
jgi:serine protease Do